MGVSGLRIYAIMLPSSDFSIAHFTSMTSPLFQCKWYDFMQQKYGVFVK